VGSHAFPSGRAGDKLALLSKWADEDPEAMAWLLSDPVLQRLLLTVIRDVTKTRLDEPLHGRGADIG
jgi:hypothetical protein